MLGERTYRIGAVEEPITGADHTGPYALSRTHLYEGSEAVHLHGADLVRERDYWIRYDRGELTFAEPLSPEDTVLVSYRCLPISIPSERVLHKFRLAEGGEEAVMVDEREPSPMAGPLDTGALRVGGSKSFAVLIGSGRELTLEQSLRMSVTGNLTPTVRVTARLTDQNLPFQPEGRSERLEELDEVLVRIESPRAEATLGDYAVRYDDTRFGRYERVLKGALGAVRAGPAEAEISGGVSRGDFRSVEIRGVEGKQGPYRILEISALGPVVSAGSERVFLDGVMMTRGDDNDYVIDYAEGTISFNPSRPIGSESRIAVDFQASGDRYRRVFLTGRLRAHTEDDRYGFGLTVLSESDDADEPEAVVLGEAEKDSLRASGDRQPLGTSARYLEEGGDYDTTGGYFVYAGRDSGDFAVSFRQVASGEGAYVDSISEEWGRRIFIHVGEGRGNYTPLVPLPLPESHSLIGFSGKARPFHALSLEAEAAWSDRDRNTLSPLDDGDNTGSGARVEARLDPVPVGPEKARLGEVGVRGSWRSVSENFEPLGRYRGPQWDERWMTGDLARAIGPGRREDDFLGAGDAFASRGRENEAEGEGTFRRATPLGTLRFSGEGGRLERDEFHARRWSWKSSIERERRFAVDFTGERITSEEADTLEGETFRRAGGASVRIGPVRPFLRLGRERREFLHAGGERRGDRGIEKRAGFAWGDAAAFTGETSVTFETRDYLDSLVGDWEEWYEARTDEVSVDWRGPVSLHALYRGRGLDYGERVTEGNRRSDLGRIELRHGGWGGLVRGNWTYEVTTEESRSRRKVLLRAPKGEEADYDSLGNYFPGEGTFNQEIVEGGAEPLIDLEAGGTIRIEPGRIGEPGRFRKGLRSETVIRVSERTTTDDAASLLLLDPSAFQRNDATLRGSASIRQEFRWTDPLSDAGFYLRYYREEREENEYETIHRDDSVREILGRAKLPFSPAVATELEWTRRSEREDSNDRRAVDLTSDDWVAAVLVQTGPRWRLRLPGAVRSDREKVREEELLEVRVEPEGTLHLAARGRLDTRFVYSRFLRENLERAGSFLRNRKEGLRWRVQFVYEWNTVLSSTVSYSGENLKGEDTEQRFRAEMRAYF